jgi:hypothetical protein
MYGKMQQTGQYLQYHDLFLLLQMDSVQVLDLCFAVTLQVEFTGTINVSFYDQQAGSTRIQPVRVPARALPQVGEGAG